jgi:hypothetical protein
MKYITLILFLICTHCFASIVGVTTHPLSEEARVLSAEMTGYMSSRNEMGAGVRYTQGFEGTLLDMSVAGGQDSRGMSLGAGVDFEVLNEDMNQPRISVKPYAQQISFEGESSTLVGAAPSLRKGIATMGREIFPYLSLPNGMRIESESQEFVFYSSLTFGASMTLPNSQEKLVISLEANKNLGASSDYVGALISWVWN